MPRPRKKSDAVERLLKEAAELGDRDLATLIEGLQVLARETRKQRTDAQGKPLNQEGYIEEKTINGCGPYRYLRYWDGKTHKSVYLGKAKP
ncbi:MAG: hypothetical protein WCD18_12405 [Thermosynechococcaceae cyanobacterium]